QVLRCGAYELIARPDVPVGSAISEYVDVAKAFFDDREAKFVNGILDAGAKPFIPFKSNATYDKGGLWARMFHYYNLYRDEFLSRYHQRSNVETTFHMIKSKFGDSVRAKTDRAMRNEVRAKILCHNICCLIQSMYEFGIEPRSWVSE
ncbi:hypothetical protein LCGC14_2916710, partial [marine sediment metagenome]